MPSEKLYARDELYRMLAAALIKKKPLPPDGKLKSWLKAILAVQTCWIYREETERVIAEKEEAKRLQRTEKPLKTQASKLISQPKQWQSALAQEILNKVSGRQNSSEQPSLF